MFRNLKKKTKKKNQLKKKVKNNFFLATPLSFLTKNCLQLLFLKSTFCMNYILMYVMQWPITTRSFKTSTSKL